MDITAPHLDFGSEVVFDMPDESEDEKFRPIPPEKFVPEWEEEVKNWMAISGHLPKNDILYDYVTIPTDLDNHGWIRWTTEEIRRCKEGYNGLCGKMYFYLNYCWIQEIGRKIRPRFRVIDSEWFRFVEACQKSKEWSIICVKRRRVGASWKEAADMLHDVMFNTNFHIGMNSKSERDSYILFNKIKFLYENLQPFMRATVSAKTKNFLDVSYKPPFINGQPNTAKIKIGNMSSVLAVAPTDNAHEGQQYSKFVCDEAGKLRNLSTLWLYTEPCLMSETRRTGLAIIFGTAGDIGAEGKDLEYMWNNAAAYHFKQFFFAGWMGLNCDQYGNDDKEGCIRWIIYKRHEKEGLRPEELNIFIQQYPLSVSEAFTITDSAGVGDRIKIMAQMQSLREIPAKKVFGWFRMTRQDEVEWVPDARGKVIIYEHPIKNIDSLYVGGCDPADHDDALKEASDLSLFIMKRANGTDPAHVVCEYTDRPKEVVEYYEQAMMASIYYNRAKILIERNRYLMISHFKGTGGLYLLARTPVGVAKITGGRADTVGVQMTPQAKEFLKGCIGRYVKDYVAWIPSMDLLKEFTYFGAKNTDKAMAFGIALMMLDDYKYPTQTKAQQLSKVPHFGYRNIGGQLKRVKYEIKPSIMEGYKAPDMKLGDPSTIVAWIPPKRL